MVDSSSGMEEIRNQKYSNNMKSIWIVGRVESFHEK
jgi:hypothetical protein